MMMDASALVASLQATKCPAPGCTMPKKIGRSFCYGCYRRLSRKQQNELYKRIGSGYEAAFQDALNELAR